MPDLWTRHRTLRGEFLYWLDKLETLLCTKPAQLGVVDFQAQLVTTLKQITKSDRKQWSGPSLIWDLVCCFHEMDDNTVANYMERPDDGLWPIVPRIYLEHLQGMPLRKISKVNRVDYAIGCAEQLYDMLRCLAGMEAMPIPEVFMSRGIALESSSTSSLPALDLERQSPRHEYISLLPSNFFHHDQDRSMFTSCHPEPPLFRERRDHEDYPDVIAPPIIGRPTMAGLQDHISTLEGVIRDTHNKQEEFKEELRELRGQKEDLHSKNLQLAKKSSELQDRLQKLSRQRSI